MASIRNRGGKWQARVKRGAILAEKSFINKRDAGRWARLTEAEIDRGEYQPPIERTAEPAPQTLTDLLTRYDKEVATLHRSATTKFNIEILKRTLGQTPLHKLNAQAIARWRDDRLTEVKAPTVTRGLNTLSSILNHARKEWCIAIANPIPDIKRPGQSQPRTRRLGEGEEARLLAVLEPRFALVVRFALATAMRQGEILSLTWRNIDFNGRVALLPMTKNGESRRVPLSSAAIQVVEEVRQAPVMPISGVVFEINRITLDKTWRRACRAAKSVDLHFHDLRREAISRLFERGLNPMEVAGISGHKTLAMLQRYTHLRAEDLARKLG
jgi:integrase